MAYYWCLDHERVEEEDSACAADRRLGPYASREAAANWKEGVEARTEAWERDEEEDQP